MLLNQLHGQILLLTRKQEDFIIVQETSNLDRFLLLEVLLLEIVGDNNFFQIFHSISIKSIAHIFLRKNEKKNSERFLNLQKFSSLYLRFHHYNQVPKTSYLHKSIRYFLFAR